MSQAAEEQRARRLKLIAAGLCTICGKEKFDVGFSTCEKCRQKRKEKRTRKREREKEKKLDRSRRNVVLTDDIVKKAADAGMSYGKYVAMIEPRGGRTA